MKLAIPFLAILSVASGCASKYGPPTTGPTASARLVAPSALVNKNGEKGSCTEYEVVVTKYYSEEFLLPAGKEIWVGHSFIADTVTTTGNCRVAYVFTPEAGARYVMRAGGRRICSASIQRVTPSGDTVDEPTFRPSRWPSLCQLPG